MRVKLLVTVLVLALGLGGVLLWQHSYDLNEQSVTINHGGHLLHGVLATPTTGTRHGLVVHLHGDGPVDATHEGGYRPIWEANAKAGYATLSWHKPGVANAPGNWLDQSMTDRAEEAVAAIAWARTRPDIDGDRIGLWGASQAGWVLPKVAARTPVRFVLAVSPAINWLQQGRFHLLAGNPTEAQLTRSDTTRRLLATQASFDDYTRAMGGETHGMTPDRWRFITKNHTADATPDLPALRRVPVLLTLAGHDRNVDTADTERGYRAALAEGGTLQVKHYPDAAHSLVKDTIERSDLKLTLTALFTPRALFATGFLDDQQRFLRDLG
ncbi:prolyl oligopeptidase family serine peptidase [Crossiella sp. CA-258035]|uniref:alpha/beta hydrolase family protein n=1 Tax=Crossiella sp. CA-258035 TaxID=2981138 RepID=UPI0024BC3BA1|nr:prolyl oligopeptidase family serine peptidase [Crossiella sp. CA-258035]WHT19968.1 prolyl oligopeptidase family serine peptidase [Crossiella sp. CA-258035]